MFCNPLLFEILRLGATAPVAPRYATVLSQNCEIL